MRELAPGEGTDDAAPGLHDRGGAPEGHRVREGGILRVGPDLRRGRVAAGHRRRVPADGEGRCAEDHRVRGDRARLDVDPAAAALRSVADALQRAVRHHPHRGRGLDLPGDGRLERGMVHAGDEVPRPVGPVVGEHGAAAAGVGGADEAVGGPARVRHSDGRGAGPGHGGEHHAQHPAVVAARERPPRIAQHLPHRHPHEIEGEGVGRAGADPADADLGPAGDGVAAVGEEDGEAVSEDPDGETGRRRALPTGPAAWAWSRGRRRDERESERRRHRRTRRDS